MTPTCFSIPLIISIELDKLLQSDLNDWDAAWRPHFSQNDNFFHFRCSDIIDCNELWKFTFILRNL